MAKTKEREKMSVPRKVILIIAIIVFCGALGMLLQNYIKGAIVQHDFNQLKVNGTHDLVALHKKNSDLVGWLEIKDTRIDYPVMQTPDDPEFYLRRNFEKKYSLAGTLFVDAASDLKKSENYIIYGHNMKNGTMFHQLLKYEDRDFYNEHKTFEYDEYRDGRQLDGKYQVVAAFRTQIYPAGSDNFKYYEYAGISDKKTFDKYVKGIRALSAYDTGITPVWGEQLVTLSTCAYHTDEGRFVVVGRRISE
ncbi:MAG: class B sortase [Anaerovoracaceae bacterium]